MPSRCSADQANRLLDLGPQVVGRAVSLRLARLPEDAVALLHAASILGEGAERPHAGALARLDPSRTSRAARLLLRSDLLIRDEPLEFFHPLVRTAIYEDLEVLTRGDGHRRAAEILLADGEPPEHAAAHLMLTTRGEDPFVVATLHGRAELTRARRPRGRRHLPHAGARGTGRRRGPRRAARRPRVRRGTHRRPGIGRAPAGGAPLSHGAGPAWREWRWRRHERCGCATGCATPLRCRSRVRDGSIRDANPDLHERGNRRATGDPARTRSHRSRRAHPERAPRGRAGSRRPHEQGDRADAVRHGQDGRGAPLERLPQARAQLPSRARRGACRRRPGLRGSALSARCADVRFGAILSILK